MSATAASARPTAADRATPGVSLTTQLAGQAELLPAAALALLVSLHRAIEPGRQQRLAPVSYTHLTLPTSDLV